MDQFRKLAHLPGFTGSIEPSLSIELCGVIESPMEVDTFTAGCADDGDEGEEEEEDDQEDANIRDMVATIMLLIVDSPHIEIAEQYTVGVIT